MDRIKIGKLMAQCRQEKQLTQEQLAEILGVTNKSVSKWENGLCLPDASLYEALCDVLNITLDELFAGQRREKQVGAAKDLLLRMLKYKLYQMSDQSISFHEFDNALSRMSEVTTLLKSFPSREDAVRYLMNETGLPHDECGAAYDFYTHLFDVDGLIENAE